MVEGTSDGDLSLTLSLMSPTDGGLPNRATYRDRALRRTDLRHLQGKALSLPLG